MKPRTYGPKLGIWFFYILLKYLGPRPAYLLLGFIAPYYASLPSVVRSMDPYLRRRFPKAGRIRRFFRGWKYIYKFGQVLVDQSAMGILGPEAFSVTFPNRDEMIDVSRKPEGMVLLCSHLGAWQISMPYIDGLKKKVNFHFDLNADRNVAHFFDFTEDRDAFSFIDPRGFMGGLIDATSVLEDGEVFATMGDRSHGWKSVIIDFYGDPAPVPLTPYKLTVATESTLGILLTRRTGPLKFETRFVDLTSQVTDGSLSKRERMVKLAEIYGRELETFLEKDPYMWFNFFDFWKTDEEENSGTGK